MKNSYFDETGNYINVGWGHTDINKCSYLVNTPEKLMYTEGVGGCVAVLTYNPTDNRASLAHLMLLKNDLTNYKEWFDEHSELHSDGTVVVLAGGSNGISDWEDCIESSRVLVDELKVFFHTKKIPVVYEDLYSEEGKHTNRSICIQQNGLVTIRKTIEDLRTFKKLGDAVTLKINLLSILQQRAAVAHTRKFKEHLHPPEASQDNPASTSNSR